MVLQSCSNENLDVFKGFHQSELLTCGCLTGQQAEAEAIATVFIGFAQNAIPKVDKKYSIR